MSKEKIISNAIIAISLFLTQYIQTNVLHSLYIAPNTSIFYLPAVVVILAAVIAPYYSIFGILIGEAIAIMLIVPNNTLGSSITKAALMALGSISTTKLLTSISSNFKSIDGPQANLDHLDAFDMILACLIYSVVTNILFRIYFVNYLDYPQSYSLFAFRIFGDFTGAFLTFVALNIGYSAYLRARSIF